MYMFNSMLFKLDLIQWFYIRPCKRHLHTFSLLAECRLKVDSWREIGVWGSEVVDPSLLYEAPSSGVRATGTSALATSVMGGLKQRRINTSLSYEMLPFTIRTSKFRRFFSYKLACANFLVTLRMTSRDLACVYFEGVSCCGERAV